MLNTKRIMTAAAVAALMSATALPAFAQTTAAPTTPVPTTNTNGREPSATNTARGAENGAQSTSVTGGPAGALGTANSGIRTVPGSAPSGGSSHGGG